MVPCGMTRLSLARPLAAAAVFLLSVLASAPAHAQVLPSAAPAPARRTAAGITAAQAQSALDVLTNDAKRAELVSTLQVILRAEQGGTRPADAAPATPATALAIPLAPNSLGAELLIGASERLSALSSNLVATAQTVTDFPLLSRWVINLARDPASRAAMFDAAWKLAVVLGAGILVERGTVRLLRRPMRGLAARVPRAHTASDDDAPEDARADARETDAADRPDGKNTADIEGIAAAEAGETEKRRRRPSALLLLRRLPFVLGRFLLDLFPVLLVPAICYALLGTSLGDQGTTRLVILAVVNAYVLCRVVVCVTRMLVAPNTPSLRLLHMSDESAAYLLRWSRRVAAVAIFGYALTEVALLFGIYSIAHDALLKIVMLVVHVMLIVVVVQTRGKVARRIQAKPDARGVIAVVRNRLARTWHWVAIFYLVALWLVWAFEVPNGFSQLVRFFLATVLIASVARLVGIAAVGAVDRALSVSPELSRRYPGLEARARSYHPIARVTVSFLVIALALICLFEAWGIDSLSWFTGNGLGAQALSAVGTIAITLLVGLAVWELVNAAVQNHLERLAREAQMARSARLRTLLPMLRTALFVAISLFAGLTILSQIGVNIAPLLAGAGVVGIAVGFGSQKLVQDVITGLFLLLENAMQVGDVVSLGGLSGTVENLSVRTIRLRALDGAVHIVPFSAVTTVTNMTRDFAYALVDISVGLNEEPNHISDLLREMVRDMRREPRWGSALRDDLEIMGIEKFVDTAWVLRIRVKTLPAQRWAVSRELNRRIKCLFDDLAIESPFTSYRVLSTATTHPAVPALPPTETSAAPETEAEKTAIVESHA
jgi:small-conductance mechanosensitive channel